jgi:hypothetical protein
VVDNDGYDGGLILFVDGGRLSALEYWWVTEDRPDEFPPSSAIGSPVIPAYPSPGYRHIGRVCVPALAL